MLRMPQAYPNHSILWALAWLPPRLRPHLPGPNNQWLQLSSLHERPLAHLPPGSLPVQLSLETGNELELPGLTLELEPLARAVEVLYSTAGRIYLKLGAVGFQQKPFTLAWSLQTPARTKENLTCSPPRETGRKWAESQKGKEVPSRVVPQNSTRKQGATRKDKLLWTSRLRIDESGRLKDQWRGDNAVIVWYRSAWRSVESIVIEYFFQLTRNL